MITTLLLDKIITIFILVRFRTCPYIILALLITYNKITGNVMGHKKFRSLAGNTFSNTYLI